MICSKNQYLAFFAKTSAKNVQKNGHWDMYRVIDLKYNFFKVVSKLCWTNYETILKCMDLAYLHESEFLQQFAFYDIFILKIFSTTRLHRNFCSKTHWQIMGISDKVHSFTFYHWACINMHASWTKATISLRVVILLH